jgi:hypothetical protein
MIMSESINPILIQLVNFGAIYKHDLPRAVGNPKSCPTVPSQSSSKDNRLPSPYVLLFPLQSISRNACGDLRGMYLR